MSIRFPAAAALAALILAIRPDVAPAKPVAVTISPAQHRFADELSERTFRYFWETTPERSCLAPDRWPSNPFSSIASTGFALTAFGIGAERGYVSRTAAAARTLSCLKFLNDAPQGPGTTGISGYHGFFYHFLDSRTGLRHDTSELSMVDTSLLLGGILFAQSYYDRDNPAEKQIRNLAEQIYARVDWTWAERDRTGTTAVNNPTSHGIVMSWRPEKGWSNHDWVGYDEGMLVYVLAAGSPTHRVGKDAWDQGWAVELGRQWGHYYGQDYLTFPPLFGHQYSHVWIDFRGIQDAFMASKGIDYFENSRRATLAQQAYGADNPNRWTGYSSSIWGWTASDGPGSFKGITVNGTERTFRGYAARGVSPTRVIDDGTIVPTAPGGSVAFAPKETLDALMAMKQRYGSRIYTRYGFKDAFNPSFTFTQLASKRGSVDPQAGWVADDYLGIDQGPIVTMLANQRDGLVWRVMRRNPHIRAGLSRLGFSGGWLGTASK